MAALFLLIAAVVLRRSGLEPWFAPEVLGDARLTALTLSGTIGVALLAIVAGWLPWNRPARGHAAWSRSSRRTRWVGSIACSWLAACVLGFGWFDLVRARLGDWILLDEVVTIAPAIIALLIGWWAHEPFARHHAVRQARVGFVLMQARVFLPLLLVPVGAILAAQEVVDLVMPANGAVGEFIGIGVAICVLLLAPALVIPVLSTAPLPAVGGFDERVRALFANNRVSLRSVRLWNTGGTMMNGLALGLLPWCRWVLLTDALVDGLQPQETLAVAGHEAGHFRHRHAAWLAGACIGSVGCTSVGIGALFEWSAPILPESAWVEWVATGLMIAIVIGFFGVVSRNCERQADAFAVRSLSRGESVTPEAVDAMRHALATVAYANGISPTRPSFRHGSIEDRRRRLALLVGRSIHALPIDREMRMIKALIAAALLVTGASVVLESMSPATGLPSSVEHLRMIPATEMRP